MKERGDELLREVAELSDPVLPAPRARQIQELAHARFVASAGRYAPRSLRACVPEMVATVLLSACIVAYLTWTAVTVASLQGSAHGVLFQPASSGAGH